MGLPNRSESSQQKLYEFAKMALIKIFAHPYATLCDLYCCGGGGFGLDNDAQIGHYIGIDVSSIGIAQLREAWESLSQKKPYPSEFFHFDPCLVCLLLLLLSFSISFAISFGYWVLVFVVLVAGLV